MESRHLRRIDRVPVTVAIAVAKEEKKRAAQKARLEKAKKRQTASAAKVPK